MRSILDLAGKEAANLSLASLADFRRAVILAASVHDLGKASNSFQRAVRNSKERQGLRHEWISAWLLVAQNDETALTLQSWLFGGDVSEFRDVVAAAVLGHHLKAEPNFSPRAGGRVEARILCEHDDFHETLCIVGQENGLNAPPTLVDVVLNWRNDLTSPLPEIHRWARRVIRRMKQDNAFRRFIATAKAMVMAADAISSASINDIGAWVRLTLERTLKPMDCKKIWQNRVDEGALHEFQRAMHEADASDICLVRAGCGSGKTVGAYLWAQRCANGRKLFFCYPTTGTAAEGFRSYVADFVRDDRKFADLITSRKEVDLEDILPSGEGFSEDQHRVDSLSLWDAPINICTADRTLGLIQNKRTSVYAFPVIAKGAFVFDEIHQYDNRMFATLLEFIKTFRGLPSRDDGAEFPPILLMTASLQKPRVDALHKALGDRLRIICGPEHHETVPRYRLRSPTERNDDIPWDEIGSALNRGDKVLWVANTVTRAVTLYDQAVEEFSNIGAEIHCYHSRFRYEDRKERHKEVMCAFERSRGPVLVVATQVCEVSLDISSDLLVSDIAPIPALIQRMGRLNRFTSIDGEKECNHKVVKPKDAVFLEPEHGFPYAGKSADGPLFEAARKWIAHLSSGTASQRDLANSFTEFDSAENRFSSSEGVEFAWPDGGPYSKEGRLRESGQTIAVIMSNEQEQCVKRVNGRIEPLLREVARRAIPMTVFPVRNQLQVDSSNGGWCKIAYAHVAPPGKVEYDKIRGARWSDDNFVIV